METITSLSPQILASSLEEKKKDLLLLDLRSFMFYNSSHVLNAINICVPNALLKRKNFSLTHIEATITNDDTKEQFKKREGTHIVLYDNDSEKMAKNCVLSCLLQKLREEGLATAVSFLSGMTHSFFAYQSNNQNKQNKIKKIKKINDQFLFFFLIHFFFFFFIFSDSFFFFFFF